MPENPLVDHLHLLFFCFEMVWIVSLQEGFSKAFWSLDAYLKRIDELGDEALFLTLSLKLKLF